MKLFRASLVVLTNNVRRSLLAALGVGIGVGAVISMLAIGEGSRLSVIGQIDNMGTNLVVISAAKVPGAAKQAAANTTVTTLTMNDAAAIKEASTLIKRLAPVHSRKATIKAGSEIVNTTVIGVPPVIQTIRNYHTVQGEFYGDEDEGTAKRVAILGQTVRQKLFSPGEGLGEKVRINGVQFTVIGFLAEKGPDINGQDQDDVILMPLSMALKKLFNATYLTNIYLQVNQAQQMDKAVGEINLLLKSRHRLSAADNPDYSVLNQADLLRTKQEIQDTLTVLLGSIAAISLFVGGIGILSVMLLSVRERTWEIGLRRAIGASRQDIRMQFVLEATVLSSFGGMLGIAFGFLLAVAITAKMGWPTVFTFSAVIGPFFYAAMIGVIFGLYPANKAAGLNPIEALRD